VISAANLAFITMIHDPNEAGLPRDPSQLADDELPEIADAAASDNPLHLRRIRSFVTRAGRVSTGQRRAMDELGPRYVVPYSPEQPDWEAVFGRRAPRILEIGFGMGATTAEIATHRSNDDFLGVEVLENMIAPESLDGVHIFFPDPWHKARHHKRRLIQRKFVALLVSRLKPGAYIHCATDWQNYAEQMLEVLGAEPALENTAEDYAPRPDYRPVTKFEKRGLRLGHGVWDLIYKRRPNS